MQDVFPMLRVYCAIWVKARSREILRTPGLSRAEASRFKRRDGGLGMIPDAFGAAGDKFVGRKVAIKVWG